MNEYEMSMLLLIDTARKCKCARAVPGWRSTRHCLEMLNAEIAAGALHSAPLQSFLHRVELDGVAELSDAVPAPRPPVDVPQDRDVQQAQSAAGAFRSCARAASSWRVNVWRWAPCWGARAGGPCGWPRRLARRSRCRPADGVEMP